MFNFFKTNFTKLVFTAMLLILVTSCASDNKLTSLSVTERLLSFPPGYYDSVVYIDNRLIGFAVNIDAPIEEQNSFAYEGDKEKTLFNPEIDPKCVRYSSFQVMSLLPDGRLGLLKECADNSGTTYLSTNRSIYAYDWQTKELKRLVAGELTHGFRPKFYTWNPDMTLGIQETNAGYQGTIYWITPDGISPMDIEIEDRGLTWNLKDFLDEKERTGFVRDPAWSPDGKTIAFFASTYGIREEPLPKYNVNYDLFFMSPSKLKPVSELMDIADADRIIWSPNNEYLLFRGCVGRPLTCGLWRYKINDKTLSLVKEGDFADYIWITNEKIIATKNIESPFNDNQIWEYSISELNGERQNQNHP
ncbi:MAG: hypothetical protein ABI904_14845 [Chloroflexota bacterium]